ncbi:MULTISPECIES: hypothetical protein [Sphingomonas]|uniref:hypothetical protein n=1 Tax=Sphingomonas TaxID=13687 RepID=UPI000DEFE18E|nr:MULTISPECIES: hypothetical protein [Sphingomonas]
MEADIRYYWRRAVEELAASRRSVTHQARDRHRHFGLLYLAKLSELGANLPFDAAELADTAKAA